jgi:hypothetical protein
LAKLLLDQLLGTLRKRCEVCAVRQKTTRQEDVSNAIGHSRIRLTVRGIGVRGEGLYSPEVLSECLHSIHDCVIIEEID